MKEERILQCIFYRVARFGAMATAILTAQLSHCDAVKIPTDAELMASFRGNREAFERLAAMGIEDYGAISLLSPEMLMTRPLTDGRQDLTAERRSEYISLLTSIKPHLVMGIDFYRITFSYSRGGVLSIGPGWMKGIAYLPYGPERVGVVVTNLDKPPSQDDVYLVPIEPKWYIIYVQLD